GRSRPRQQRPDGLPFLPSPPHPTGEEEVPCKTFKAKSSKRDTSPACNYRRADAVKLKGTPKGVRCLQARHALRRTSRRATQTETPPPLGSRHLPWAAKEVQTQAIQGELGGAAAD